MEAGQDGRGWEYWERVWDWDWQEGVLCRVCAVCVLVGAAQTWNLGARWSKTSMPVIVPGLVAYCMCLPPA